MNENVTHPKHYNSGKIEVIEAIEDWKLNFHKGNAVKYVARAGKKIPEKSTEEIIRAIAVQDLEKAVWYIEREIENIRAEAPTYDKRRPNDMNPKAEEPVYPIHAHRTEVRGRWEKLYFNNEHEVIAFVPNVPVPGANTLAGCSETILRTLM